MSYRLFQMLFLLEFSILNSFENEQLLCYSCKGIECEQITTTNENKILCNKKTQLCWVKFLRILSIIFLILFDFEGWFY
jgi:hypothetical protein